MWDERYSVDEYIYGRQPNTFIEENAKKLINPVLSIAEGEGRNGVFLASLGFDVLGVDGSEIALSKALALAKLKEVEIQTQVCDLAVFDPNINFYGSVISIFAHLPSSIRSTLYQKIYNSLVPGGIILLEAYSENQFSRNTGGPKDLDMLMTVDKIKAEFSKFDIVMLHEIIRDVNEGSYHTGEASVIQFIGKKP